MSLWIGTAAGAFEYDDELHPTIEATRINHVAVEGDDWWAVDGRGRIHRNGETVARMPEGAVPLCIRPSRGVVWVGASEGRLYSLERGRLTEDEFFANAPDRDTWYTPWGAPVDIRSLALDADHTLYVNVHVGGVLRYDNTGLVPTVDIDADVHQVAAHPGRKGLIYAASAHGLGVSHNGHDFEFHVEGLHAQYCRAVAASDQTVLVSASTGPQTKQGRVYQASVEGGTLTTAHRGLPEWFDGNVNTHCLASDGANFYLGFGDTVWVSAAEAIDWSELVSGLPKITCIA